MSGFSPEIRHHQIENQNHRCALLNLQIDFLEGHHCIPKIRGGSNNIHNCLEVAGFNPYCAYGTPVPDVHEILDQLALNCGLYIHPDKLILVTADMMPSDCFKSPQIQSRLVDFDNRQRNRQKNLEQIFGYRSVILPLVQVRQESTF